MTSDPTLIADVTNVLGDTITAAVRPEAAPGLTFSKGHAYFVGQVGAYVRIPLGLVDLFAIVVQVGSASTSDVEPVEGGIPGRPWMRLELLGEAHRDGTFARGVARYPSIGDKVQLVTSHDLNRLYQVDAKEQSLRIGHVSNAPHLPALVDVGKMVNRHCAVVGSTGSGKSTTVATILSSLACENRFPSSRVIIFDVHGEYASAFGESADRMRVDSEDSNSQGSYEQRLCLPYWALSFEDFLDLSLGHVDENSATSVQQLVTEAKRKFVERHEGLGLKPSAVTADTPVPFSIRELWMNLHEQQFATHTVQANAQTPATRAYERDELGELNVGDSESIIPPVYQPSHAAKIFLSGGNNLNIRRQTNSLGARLRDPRYDFLFRPGRWDVGRDGEVHADLGDFLESWLGSKKNIVIADLSGIPNQVLHRVVSVLLRLLYESLIWARNFSEGGRARPVFLVLEEAHRYLREGNDSAGEIVERIVKEGRKFGVGVMIVSQRPSEIRPTVLSQIGSYVVMRLTNAADRSLVRASLPDNLSGIFDSIPVLRTGESLVTGEMVKLPSRVMISSSPTSRRDSSDPVVVGRLESGGWDVPRVAQDYHDVAWAWRNLTSVSRRTVRD